MGNTPSATTPPKRSVFFISDGTGITTETLGRSLLTQFEGFLFQESHLPFVDSPEKARTAVERIDHAAQADGCRPLVFTTLIHREVREIIARSRAMIVPFFETFTAPLERELGMSAAPVAGRTHGMGDYDAYAARMGALNFALTHDDGATTRQYALADLIIVGVSRCGKTPTSLYLALQFGIHVANYPITEEDLDDGNLPSLLHPYREKLFGLTIEPNRLKQIRSERRPNSRYATLTQCKMEVEAVERIFRAEGIRYLNTTRMSVEEIAASILLHANLKRRL